MGHCTLHLICQDNIKAAGSI